MSDLPLVSVIMAVYAGDKCHYLRSAIESVLDQTWRNLELILVVDGPVPEAVGATVSDFPKRDPRVVVLRRPVNEGPGAARNAGISLAKGDYIAILDADDRALPERLERQIRHLRESGADLAGSFYHVIDTAGRRLFVKSLPEASPALRRWMVVLNPIANSTVVAHAEVLKNQGYPTQYRFAEDFHLWVTLAQKGYVLANLPDALTEHRHDTDFLRRRTGVAVFRVDVRAKLRAATLYKWPWRPAVALIAVLSTLPRLLPRPLLRLAYRIRNRGLFLHTSGRE